MPKGKFPKMKGSICNVPIDTAETVNVLPHGADSNGLIVVKLKRKLCYRGHVYFESDQELENPDTLEEEENPLNLHRFNFQETVFVPTIVSEEEVSIASGEGKQPLSILSDKFCEELAFPHLFPRGRFGYKVDRQI